MSEETLLAVCGDPYYVNLVAIDFLNGLGWSRQRRKKWLRRHGFRLDRTAVIADEEIEEAGYS